MANVLHIQVFMISVLPACTGLGGFDIPPRQSKPAPYVRVCTRLSVDKYRCPNLGSSQIGSFTCRHCCSTSTRRQPRW
ncbi:hypothetical protein EV424DRAFT_1028026 [Suillus variegatus]|nr:hypothetical protein EV424DRAFT_1028026 [Suillus variegatus]